MIVLQVQPALCGNLFIVPSCLGYSFVVERLWQKKRPTKNVGRFTG